MMISDTIYELCLPILQDLNLEDEIKTEKLEELLAQKTSLKGTIRDDTILDALWRFRESKGPSSSPVPMRHTVVRRPSPAPWQLQRSSTPSASSPGAISSPAPPPGFGVAPPAFMRTKSSTASPFTSPRPSPRLAFSSPIPHSPSLQSYEFPTETSPSRETYGDLGSENVDWLVNDDAGSTASSGGGAYPFESNLNGGAASYIQPQQVDMGPYDMLRSVVGEGRSDEEIENALQLNNYDLSATINTLMEGQNWEQHPMQSPPADPSATIVIGKSMSTNTQRPVTPSGQQQRSGIICKYYLSTGSCLRADCRFIHDSSNLICKYWLMGNCLAGDTCGFSHDPSTLVSRVGVDENQSPQPTFQVQDYNSFPSLQPVTSEQWASYQNQISNGGYPSPMYNPNGLVAPGFRSGQMYYGDGSSQRSRSRPASRSRSREPTPPVPAVDDTEAFPTLGAATVKAAKKHHGKRGGHGHNHREALPAGPTSLADVVRMSPSPVPSLTKKSLRSNKSFTSTRENSAAAQAIPPPQHVPWLETGDKANKAYLKARQDAIKHGGLRNKFLQSAAQAWNRNDSRAAKALSLRGQSENDLMRKAHREAARQLYEERNKDRTPNSELYVDLHGLHPDEAVEYLERVLLDQQSSPAPLYAITGTGHHSKNGKDKVGKAIRGFLNEWRYAYREFSVPGDRNNVGGILGIDPRSFDRSAAALGSAGDVGELETDERKEGLHGVSGVGQHPVMVTLVREPPRGPASVSAAPAPVVGKNVP